MTQSISEAIQQVMADNGQPNLDAPLELEEEALDKLLVSSFPEVREEYPGLAVILSRLYRLEYREAVTEARALAPEKLKELRRCLNPVMLAPLKKEWTSHGITRSFRFWTDVQKRNYLMFSTWIIEALSDEYLVCFGYGAVLAAIRDGDFLPHDDDLDLIVLIREGQAKSYKEGMRKILKKVENFGFRIKGDYVAHRHLCNERFLVDLFVGMEEEGFASWHPGPRQILPTSSIFPARNVEMHGIQIPIPNDAERYLAAVYGEDWREPLPGWTHNFDPSPYKDWFFKKE